MIAQPWDIRRVRVPPASIGFTVLLGFLVALPSFGIDMSLPALTATGAALGVAPERAGLMMSLFMLGFAVAPLFYGPASDRYGRKPVVVFACALFVIAALTVPSFEFPRNFPPSVHFIGTPPIIPDQARCRVGPTSSMARARWCWLRGERWPITISVC
jgi:MFS family permease